MAPRREAHTGARNTRASRIVRAQVRVPFGSGEGLGLRLGRGLGLGLGLGFGLGVEGQGYAARDLARRPPTSRRRGRG